MPKRGYNLKQSGRRKIRPSRLTLNEKNGLLVSVSDSTLTSSGQLFLFFQLKRPVQDTHGVLNAGLTNNAGYPYL